MSVFKYKKGVQAINFLAVWDGGSIDKLKAMKLMWLADRLHLRKYGRSITGDQYCALPLGPVPSGTLSLVNSEQLAQHPEALIYRNKFIKVDEANNRRIASVANPDEKVFSDTDEEALWDIYVEFSTQSSSQLVNLSHEYPEWKKWQAQIESGTEASSFKMPYADFFGNPTTIEDAFFAQSDDYTERVKQDFDKSEVISSFLS